MKKKIAIIGAGLSGLCAAKKLSRDYDVEIFDKSRGVSGRMSTRRIDDYYFDHGTQFFTAKSKEFKAFCHEAKSNNIIDEWHCRFAEITKNQITRSWDFNTTKSHYVATPHMNSLCKYLAIDLNIRLSTEITKINYQNHAWSLKSANNDIFDNYDYLILAIPSHQALNLVPRNFQHYTRIENTKMIGCFALMLGFSEQLKLDFDAALVKESIISWISINSSKPDRPDYFSLVINSSNKWAEENLENDPEELKQILIKELKNIIDFDTDKLVHQILHRWRYANIKKQEGEKSLFDPNLNLGICGDWLISGRVESAFLSGIDLASKF
ncbi:MAG: FAD-dependent oxidoreductase [Rickettsiales bacterium]|nr:FAD-dependent oxidoreductase [Rickettsiales bacterium]